MTIDIKEYRPPGETIRNFLRSNAFVRGIMGPFGSGKTSAIIMELIRRAQMQAKGPDGIRRTRFAIVRGTYPELRTTTLNSFQQMMPLEYGRITYDSPIRFVLKTDEIDSEFYFLALEKDEDVKKVLSMELTGCAIDEAREIPKSLIDALSGRVGRFPSQAMGGCTWSGLVMATNPPDTESWWYRLSEVETPAGWEFFKQPSGLSAEAENTANLPQDYYARLASGKDEDWIAAYVDGRYAFVVDGKPVFTMWRDSYHVAPTPIAPVPGVGLIVGVDFGLSPAAAICQHQGDGRWFVIDELCAEDSGIKRFGELLVSFIRRTYPDHADNVLIFGDPAGNQRSQVDERTALEVLRTACGWTCRAAPSNDLTARLESVKQCLNRVVDARPGLLVSPKCAMLRKGFAGVNARSPWARSAPPAGACGARQLCRLSFGSSGSPARLTWQPLGRNDTGVAVQLPPECGLIEITADGDFAKGVLLLEISNDGADFHTAAAPLGGPSSQRLNVKPCYFRPRIEGGSYQTAVVVNLTARAQ